MNFSEDIRIRQSRRDAGGGEAAEAGVPNRCQSIESLGSAKNMVGVHITE
jgi:hypothetical protein